MAGSRAIRVPNAVGVMRRRASISSAYGRTGSSRAQPGAAASTSRLRWPAACGMPTTAAVAAAIGTVRDSALMPVKRSPTCWVSTM